MEATSVAGEQFISFSLSLSSLLRRWCGRERGDGGKLVVGVGAPTPSLGKAEGEEEGLGKRNVKEKRVQPVAEFIWGLPTFLAIVNQKKH